MAMIALLVPGLAGAAEVTFRSGPDPVALVELFTSEGCSSCPPAEQWLAARRTDPGLWREFVPVAWHVTYWDHLGWPDRLAQRAFTDRQYAYAAAWHRNSVYTPCFVRDGREWQPGRGAAAPPTAGMLRARYDSQTGILQVAFRPSSPADLPLDVHVARLGGGLVTPVRAGENSGRTLEHEFAVLAVAQGPLLREGAAFRGTVTLPSAPSTPRRALAVWVTRRGGLVPLQAAGGWINP
jgi:hypothetical protein